MSSKNSHVDYWVACSGGVDSVVLANLFCLLNKSFGILHCNFRLRGKDSKNDEIFVRDLAARLEVPIQVKSFDIEKHIETYGGNTQLAARDLRYEWFEEVKKNTNAIIALGHHQDDQVETFLLQLSRGGKVNGLASMAVFHKDYFRPLLKYKKEDIYLIAKNNNWEWREDLSNKTNKYKRNFYRNELIPLLKENNLHHKEITDLVCDFQTLADYFETIIWTIPKLGNLDVISFNLWSNLSFWMKQDLLKKMNLTAFSIKDIDKLLKSTKGVNIKRNNIIIWNEGYYLIVSPDEPDDSVSELIIEKVNKSDMVFDGKGVYIDGDKVGNDLRIRNWKAGDKFQPLGMKGRKLVSDYLKDKKVPAFEKKNVNVLVSDNQVIAVMGFAPDERVKVSNSTTNIYRVSKKQV